MCTYNARPFIEEAVGSVLRQTYTNLEFIISDDCSTDGTREWLQTLTDPRIKLHLQQKNLGYVANKNFVHQQAKGEYITQMDNDDVCSPSRLEKQLAVVLKNPAIKLVGCGYRLIDSAGTELSTYSIGKEGMIEKKGEGDYPFWFPSLLIHRTVFEEIGLFHLYFSGALGDDLYWTVRANERHPIWCLPDVLYSYRINPGSITNTFNNRHKLIMTAVLTELIQQRSRTGTDWLEKGNTAALNAFEHQLLTDKKYMGEQYRIWAAKAVNKKGWGEAKKLLHISFQHHPTNPLWWRTFIYFLRSRFTA